MRANFLLPFHYIIIRDIKNYAINIFDMDPQFYNNLFNMNQQAL